MKKLQKGAVVAATVSDPQGRNWKPRPLVIVSEPAEGEMLVGVAITSTFSDPIDGDEVLLPFHPGGNARTGLRKRSVAKCSWLVELHPDDIERVHGIVPKSHMAAIEERLPSQ